MLRNYSLVIEHLHWALLYDNSFISLILTHIFLPKISISIVTFKNTLQLFSYLKNHFMTYFSADLVPLNQINDSPVYIYETHYKVYLIQPFFRSNLLSYIYIETYKFQTPRYTPISTKPICNTYIYMYTNYVVY